MLTRLPGPARIHRHHRRVAPAAVAHPVATEPWWSWPAPELLARLESRAEGLPSPRAAELLARHGANALEEHRLRAVWELLLGQLATPLQLILVFAAAVSLLAREWVDAAVVLGIVAGSSALGTIQEARAGRAIAILRARLVHQVQVRRGGAVCTVPAREVVPGDLVLLVAGSLVPADGRILDSRDLAVSEASLSGESFPVDKQAGSCAVDTPLSARSNCLWAGTTVQSGAGTLLVVATGANTAYGAIAGRLAVRPQETEFARGLRQFGRMLTEVMVALVLLVFAANVWFARPAIESLLFALALAVGLSPEMLPAVLAVNLAAGARRMAAHGVIVRRLESIENLGSIDVLCTDKTGTLTGGEVRLAGALDAAGEPSTRTGVAAWHNARLQTGLPNPLDAAILAAPSAGPGGEWAVLSGGDEVEKIDEIPYDFSRRRLGVVLRVAGGVPRLVVKGAVAEVLSVSTRVALAEPGARSSDAARRQEGSAALLGAAGASCGDGEPPALASSELDEAQRAALAAQAARWASEGYRVLAVAERRLPGRTAPFGRADEQELTLLGFLRFVDPAKPDARAVLAGLAELGVTVKVVSGDSRAVVAHLAREVGLATAPVLDGTALAAMSEEALWHRAPRTSLFVEVDPAQKERILRALRRAGHVVGYLGDGINDAPALQAADVGISVDRAVEVAREAADLVLLAPDLGILREGIAEGRRTHANALKYVYTTTSANFGNMASMAVASFALPYLPLLASQILLNNFLSDFPALALAGDHVDREQVARPRRLEIAAIRRFMLIFGGISSMFDLLLFALLAGVLAVSAPVFHTAWFVLSLLTELAVAMVVRTTRPFLRSRASPALWGSSLAVAVLAMAIPYLPCSGWLGFTPLPPCFLAWWRC